jgi:hypothetical protein
MKFREFAMERQIVGVVLMLAAAAAVPSGTAAQDMQRSLAERGAIEIEKAQLVGKLRAAVEMRTTTGAPYSAEATTETVQLLADGNRIARRTIVRIFRDSEGRTRRENLTSDGSGVEAVTIVDPVAGTSVMLDPAARRVFGQGRGGSVGMRLSPQAEAEARRRAEIAVQGPPPLPPPAPPMTGVLRRSGRGGYEHTNREDLGQRTIEGVTARGTRTTTVIPAGAIGNDQPIRIVSEEWFSPDLQVLVLTKHSDPRSGDTSYTLSGIIRAEPDRSLFEVPADYARR